MQIQLGRFTVPVTVTNVLVALTVLVSLAITISGNEQLAAVAGGFIPERFSESLPPEIWGVPFWLTPLTATLIHYGPLHLLLNMVMLVAIGYFVERTLGWRATLLIYIVGAYAAAAGQWAASEWLPGGNPIAAAAGASGAISALIGAYAMLYSRPKTQAFGPGSAMVVNALWLLVAWAVLSYALALVLTPGGVQIGWGAHIGGFIAGQLLALPLLRLRYRHA